MALSAVIWWLALVHADDALRKTLETARPTRNLQNDSVQFRVNMTPPAVMAFRGLSTLAPDLPLVLLRVPTRARPKVRGLRVLLCWRMGEMGTYLGIVTNRARYISALSMFLNLYRWYGALSPDA